MFHAIALLAIKAHQFTRLKSPGQGKRAPREGLKIDPNTISSLQLERQKNVFYGSYAICVGGGDCK